MEDIMQNIRKAGTKRKISEVKIWLFEICKQKILQQKSKRKKETKIYNISKRKRYYYRCE